MPLLSFVFWSFMRGYHVYHDVWTNIEVNQDIILQKQPNNEFDQHAIGGFVKDLIPEQMLTKIGHLPRELAGSLVGAASSR